MDKGWVKLFRKFTDWEWYDDINTKVLFLHLLLKVNHKDKNWRNTVVKRGELITSSFNLAKETQLTRQQIRLSLSKLISSGDIVKKTTNKYTHLTICNYSSYQDTQKENNQQTTIKQPTNNHQTTTTKEVKNERIKEKEYIGGSHILAIRVKEQLKDVSKMHSQLTDEECNKLLNRFDKVLVWETLLAMDNNTNLKKYKSVYRTCLQWCKNAKERTQHEKGNQRHNGQGEQYNPAGKAYDNADNQDF